MNPSKFKVIVELGGGLGNQMFQYAAGYALARHHRTSLLLNPRVAYKQGHGRYMLDHLQIEGSIIEPGELDSAGITSTGPSLIQRAQIRLLKKSLFRFGPMHIYHEPAFHFQNSFLSARPPVLIRGYFQSEKYFDRYADEIRRMFSLAQPLSSESRAMEQRIGQSPCPVAVHVRRGDYVHVPAAARVHGHLGVKYYARGLSVLHGSCSQALQPYFFSDDLPYVREHFGQIRDAVFVGGNEDRPWEDMYLISRCKHQIIANSTFSWWGAWLNPSTDKTVIAPRAWFQRKILGAPDTSDLCPRSWIRV